MKILAIGAHPDDIEFGMGATLSKHILKGDEVSVLILTDGYRDYSGDYNRSDIRRQESKDALGILGYEKYIIFLRFPNIEINQIKIKLIEREINKFKPDRIYTHSKNDRHQDHRNCHDIVLSAGRYVNDILLFEVYSSLQEFLPKYIVNVSKELLDLKVKAVKCFKSQFKKMYLIAKIVRASAIKNSLYTYARQRDEISYSEGFEIVRIVEK